MGVESKSVLYDVIDKIGRERIESEIANTHNTAEIIKNIFSACMTALRQHDYDKEKVHTELVIALMHYLFTVCLIQAQRKFEYNNDLTIDLVIPSSRQLRKNPKHALTITIPKKIDQSSNNAQTDALKEIQPNKENIWLVFGHYSDELMSMCKEFRTYVPDDYVKEPLRPLSSIIDDIKLFLEVNKIKNFKILPI